MNNPAASGGEFSPREIKTVLYQGTTLVVPQVRKINAGFSP
jgi:hypothetical protein